MSTKNAIAKKRVRSAPQPKPAAVKKSRRKTKPTARAAKAGLMLAARSFELAKGSLTTLLRELKEECGSHNADSGIQQLEARIRKADVCTAEVAVSAMQFQRRTIFGHCHE